MTSDLRDELDTRRAQRNVLALYFAGHPHQLVTHDTLKALVGENYRSRIAECRKTLGMRIDNVPQFLADGQRTYGAYRHIPVQLPVAETRVDGLLFDLHVRG